MVYLITLGILFVVNFIICSIITILFGRTRKLDWAIVAVISFLLALIVMAF
ncbi:hypothetical protein [Sporosarcina cyprini]|uniref:hypothetical protein n=1 Tax=Sporosarcina cyprini TaxID=2910523 RepID=UPI001EDE9785|nr:hypothetical protein [Sporosarcina cyprini]MCG3089709.1 hypothetical protein [Sporosarcina cyprini]